MRGVLCRKTMTNFRKAAETMKKHEEQSEHKSSCARAVGFIATHQGITHTVHQHMVDHNQTQLAENVEKLTSLLRTIEFCGRQNNSLKRTS